MKIGLCGVGLTGSAMLKSLEKKGFKLLENLFLYDKFKKVYDDETYPNGNLNDLYKCDQVYLSLPTLYNDEIKEYDKKSINDTIENFNNANYNGLLILKCTVEPKVTENLALIYPNLKLIYVPEFLSSSTAFEDFHYQKHTIIGYTTTLLSDKIDKLEEINYDNYLLQNCNSLNKLVNFYETYYPNSRISITDSTTAETMKISCNSFYSVKVQFFTEIYLLCNDMNISYGKMVSLMLKNEWINEMHTMVPGKDGNISYGGLCFPKDTNALCEFMNKNDIPNGVLKNCILERNKMRKDN